MIATILTKSLRLVPWKWRDRIKNWRILGSVQRRLVGYFLSGHEFVHKIDAGPARGLRAAIRLPEDKGLWTGTYELPLATAIAAAVRPGMTCLDVGGWHGFFGAVMALRGAGTVHIFEPLPENACTIQKLQSLNPRLPLRLHQMALGASSGMAEFCVMEQSSMGKLRHSAFQPERKGSENIRVVMSTIDELLSQGRIGPPDLIKMDVEGAELDVLRGAITVLRERRPELFIECHSPSLRIECENLLRSLSYRVSGIDSDGDGGKIRDVSHLRASAGA